MQIRHVSWQAKARVKMAEMESKTPRKWMLKQADLDKAAEQRNLTGSFIEQFISEGEKGIVRNDSPCLIEKIKCQRYSAVEVAEAYCKTAAISQQIVSEPYSCL